MATILNQGLHRTLGIQFEYKIKLQEFLDEARTDALVSSYSNGSNTAANRLALYNSFVKAGPTMGFEAKKIAYGLLEYICEALNANADVPADDKTSINDLLVQVTRYVGMEGEEDFHFMVATFNLAEVISAIIAEVVPAPQAPVGGLVTLSLTKQGSGYTTDGTATSGTVSVKIESTETTNPAGYTFGVATATLTAGKITAIGAITTAGDGFEVGQIVALNVNTAVSTGATQKTAALAKVVAVA
jgi:hypothetical protein